MVEKENIAEEYNWLNHKRERYFGIKGSSPSLLERGWGEVLVRREKLKMN